MATLKANKLRFSINFLRHCVLALTIGSVRLLPSRDFGKSADRQIGRSANRQIGKLVVSGLCPRQQLKFKTTVAHKGRRYKNFRQFQTSVAYKWRRYHQFTGRVTRGVGRGQANWQIGKLAGQDVGRKISAHKDVRPPGQKFFRFTGGRGSCRAVISASRQIGRPAIRQIGKSAGRQIGKWGNW